MITKCRVWLAKKLLPKEFRELFKGVIMALLSSGVSISDADKVSVILMRRDIEFIEVLKEVRARLDADIKLQEALIEERELADFSSKSVIQ